MAWSDMRERSIDVRALPAVRTIEEIDDDETPHVTVIGVRQWLIYTVEKYPV